MGHPTPAAFTFEKTVPGGSADAYFEEHFGWEFNGQDAQMDGAFNQLLQYQVRLKTPPLPMVSSSEDDTDPVQLPGDGDSALRPRHRGSEAYHHCAMTGLIGDAILISLDDRR